MHVFSHRGRTWMIPSPRAAPQSDTRVRRENKDAHGLASPAALRVIVLSVSFLAKKVLPGGLQKAFPVFHWEVLFFQLSSKQGGVGPIFFLGNYRRNRAEFAANLFLGASQKRELPVRSWPETGGQKYEGSKHSIWAHVIGQHHLPPVSGRTPTGTSRFSLLWSAPTRFWPQFCCILLLFTSLRVFDDHPSVKEYTWYEVWYV